ncbi:MAG: hypothetical protein U0871_24770 [Gemmataceae bacterium]
MTEPWFSEQMAGLVGGLGGGGLGSLAGCYGGLAGWLAPKGKAKGFVFAVHWAFLLLGVAALAVAVTALAVGQPYHVWYVFLLPGLLFTLLFGLLFPVIRQRYREAEERRMTAEDMG